MNLAQINPAWPNSLRWFLVQNSVNFCPWFFLSEPNEFKSVAKVFEDEDLKNRKVFVFASRQDNDDFAGLEVVNGTILDKVLVFHPTFTTNQSIRDWDIVDSEFSDVFEFISKRVVEDMRDWALTEDASELTE